MFKKYDVMTHEFRDNELINAFYDIVRVDKVNMDYKNGKPWNGDILEVLNDDYAPAKTFKYSDNAYITKEQHYKDGKLTGRCIETSSNGVRGLSQEFTAEMAHFNDGILDGKYEACSWRKSDFKFIKPFKHVPELWNAEIKGIFNNGVFSGSIMLNSFRDVYIINNGQLTHSTQHINKDVVIFKNYENGKLVLSEKYNKSHLIEKKEYKKEYKIKDTTEDEIKATNVMLGITGAVTAVSVASYITSVYPSKEKAPEDKKDAPQEIKANQTKLNTDEAKMFQLMLGMPEKFKAFMEKHKDLNINAANENGETVLMSALTNDKLDNAEYILEKFGDKIEYKARTNDGIGYSEIMKARLHSSTADAQDIRINRMIKENTQKEEQQIKEGKARSTDSYVFYDLKKEKAKE